MLARAARLHSGRKSKASSGLGSGILFSHYLFVTPAAQSSGNAVNLMARTKKADVPMPLRVWLRRLIHLRAYGMSGPPFNSSCNVAGQCTLNVQESQGDGCEGKK
jgi:hypothetical protein